MRVLLQNTETKLYFIDTDQWTDDPLKATDFGEVELAVDVYHRHDLAYAQIVVEPVSRPSGNADLSELRKYAHAQG
jgi:hypothetical protein